MLGQQLVKHLCWLAASAPCAPLPPPLRKQLCMHESEPACLQRLSANSRLLGSCSGNYQLQLIFACSFPLQCPACCCFLPTKLQPTLVRQHFGSWLAPLKLDIAGGPRLNRFKAQVQGLASGSHEVQGAPVLHFPYLSIPDARCARSLGFRLVSRGWASRHCCLRPALLLLCVGGKMWPSKATG